MKVILSRKGMDSQSGGIPSPIMPDGTLASLPIPDNTSGVAYADLRYQGQSYREIIHQLSPHFDFTKKPMCHLDPDIFRDIKGRQDNWKPAFGQCDTSACHLDKKGVGIGDLFLFYGMFRQTECGSDGSLKFVRNAPIIHIIYGYMKVGEVLYNADEIKAYSPQHPHAVNLQRKYNRLYVPAEFGTFHYDEQLVLTKPGQSSRRLWVLPEFFADPNIEISWQGENHPISKDGDAELNSACRGQEFVITATTEEAENNLLAWVDCLLQAGTKGGR